MKRRQWYLVATLGTAAALAISGSVGWMDHADREDSWAQTREGFATTLVALDVRIERIRLDPPEPDSTGALVLPAALADRSAQISAMLDSLESVSDLDRMGAIAGLRANLADLEYRVDLAELACARNSTAVDSLVAEWLREDKARLAAAGRLLADSSATAIFDAALRQARGEHEQLDSRYAGLRERDAGADALHAFGLDLAGVRRHHRAIVRSIERSS